MSKPSLVFAGNRRIGLHCLRLLLDADWPPVALMIPTGQKAECVQEMKALLPDVPVLEGTTFRKPKGLSVLRGLGPDYIVSVHFPYIIPPEVLEIPRIGVLNLHPAYLPYNRGWHTPSWAIIEGTPYGATLHWVDEGLDTGDIALRREVPILPSDTAHTLYQRVLAAEAELFREAIPLMMSRALPRIPQTGKATTHRKEDLASIQHLNLEATAKVGDIVNLLRGLTTNRWDEAAWFEVDGVRYRIRVEIKREGEDE